MDGIDNSGNLLVMATTNHLRDIPEPLKRPGRFDKKIEIDNPDSNTRKIMVQKFLGKFNCDCTKVDCNRIAKITSGCIASTIEAICNDAYLRCGKVLTTKDLEKSYDRVENGNYQKSVDAFKDYRIAIHEAGHVVALMSSKHWTFYQATFNSTGGVTERNHIEEREDTIEKRKEHIMICLAGAVAEELVLGHHDVGSYEDYNRAFDYCQRLLQRVCIKGIKWLQASNSGWSQSPERKRNSEIVTTIKR